MTFYILSSFFAFSIVCIIASTLQLLGWIVLYNVKDERIKTQTLSFLQLISASKNSNWPVGQYCSYNFYTEVAWLLYSIVVRSLHWSVFVSNFYRLATDLPNLQKNFKYIKELYNTHFLANIWCLSCPKPFLAIN